MIKQKKQAYNEMSIVIVAKLLLASPTKENFREEYEEE